MLQERGVVNLYFPLLIPQSVFRQEKEQISGFAPEILTATAVGDKQLNEPLYIRPTSEILVAHQLKKEVRSYRDLPVK